jgi:hypothetical protein
MATPVPCRFLSHDPAIASASALAEIQPAFVVVVATAPQLDLVDGRLATENMRIDVVELDEPALIAPAAGLSRLRSESVAAHLAGPLRVPGADEGAASEIPQPDRSLDLSRGLARTRFRHTRRVGFGGVGKLLLRQIYQQRSQGSVEDRRIIARRDGVAKHVLGQPELLERVATDRELELVAVRRERRHRDWTDRQWMGRGTRCGSRNGNSCWRRRGRSGRRRRERHRRGSRGWQEPNGCRHIGPGRERGDDLFDLGLPLAAGGVEHLTVVARRQVRRKEPHRGQIPTPDSAAALHRRPAPSAPASDRSAARSILHSRHPLADGKRQFLVPL